MKLLFFKLLSLSLFVVLSTLFVFGYELSNDEYDLLDRVEDRLFDSMEEKNWEPDRVIENIEILMERRALSPKGEQLLLQLIDDIDRYWYEGDEDERYMSEQDCSEDEYFDEFEEWCFPIEESDIDGEWDEMHDDEDDDFPVLAAYLLDSEDQLLLVDGDQHPDHVAIWAQFSTMIPPFLRDDLVEVNFGDSSESDTAAYVTESNALQEKRQIAFNVDSYIPEGERDIQESIHTNIHEFAHLLSFDTSQINVVPSEISDREFERYSEKCLTYMMSEGCLLRTAYIKLFIDAFWDEQERNRAREDEQSDIFTEDEYVSDYAATNPSEDLAESFTHFILKKKPVGTSEANQKVIFFYQFDELVKMRALIRGRIRALDQKG